MRYKGSIFKNRKFDFKKLEKFGFQLTDEKYVYRTTILDNSFELTIKIDSNGDVDSRLVEVVSGEDYNLIYVKNAEGEFVGSVREEFENVLTKIKEECTFFSTFETELASSVIEYIKNKYSSPPEFLWEKFPDTCIFRKNDKKGKWFAVLLTVAKQKIGLEGRENIEIINLKAKPEKIEKIVDNKNYFPAYHMNKKHWFTICLDGSVSAGEIEKLIDESYMMI